MAKRAYKIEIERRPVSRYMRPDRYEYNVVAANAEDAIRKTRRQATKDTGYSHPWHIKSLLELGDAI